MNILDTLIIVVHILTALAIIGFILLQQGKGAEAGSSFGGGASQTMFGSRGTGNFLSRTTAILAAIFFVTSILLTTFAKNRYVPVNEIIPKAVVEDVQNNQGNLPANNTQNSSQTPELPTEQNPSNLPSPAP